MKSRLAIILFFFICFNVNSHKTSILETPQLIGNWEFKYLLVKNKIKTWKIIRDKNNLDYMNLHFNSDTFDVAGSLIIKNGKYTLDKNSIIFKTNTSIDIIPKDNKTDYRKNINWTRNFFEGKSYYSIKNNTELRLHKNVDSVLVFKRF